MTTSECTPHRLYCLLGSLNDFEQLCLITTICLDIKHDQKDRGDQNEQKASDKSEIVGFHGRKMDQREDITI